MAQLLPVVNGFVKQNATADSSVLMRGKGCRIAWLWFTVDLNHQ